jgi:large subunit ribosomal protein L7/L12
MAKLTKEDFISALKEMTILEVKELVDAMKEEFGVDPSAVAVAAAPAAGAAAAEDDAAKTVVLKDAGATKMQVIKLLKEITGLGLVEAKALADNGGNVKENVPAKEAEEIKAQLEAAGAEVELV